MAVINQYKFHGKYVDAAETGTLLSPLISETIIIKSLRVTNKSGSNTPTLTYTTIGTVTDGVVIGISYLNIKKEVTV